MSAAPTTSKRRLTALLPKATLGLPYRSELKLRGWVPPLKCEFLGGKLPPGMEFDDTSGAVHGVPSGRGTYTFLVRVTDASVPPKTEVCAFGLAVKRAVNKK